jgi:hypothetical protein
MTTKTTAVIVLAVFVAAPETTIQYIIIEKKYLPPPGPAQ